MFIIFTNTAAFFKSIVEVSWVYIGKKSSDYNTSMNQRNIETENKKSGEF